MKHFVVFLFALLFTASLMWPSEGAIHGDGLHLAFGWLIAGVVVSVAAARMGASHVSRTSFSGKGMLSCGAVVLLIAGVWLSTWHVFQVQGDRRAALNLAFEWTAIVSAWWAARWLLRAMHARQWLVSMLVGLSLGTAFVGIVQHHITNQRQAEWYQDQKSLMNDAGGSGDSAVALDGVTASNDFRRMGIPVSGPSLKLFESRLLNSTEPTGPFALANTLGGFLAAALVLLVGGVTFGRETGGRMSIFSWGIVTLAFIAMAYCLILTKSRTAWVGLSCGIAMLFLQSRRAVWSSPAVRRLCVGGAVVFGLAAAIGIGSGAIDKEVVLESPRSLQFRLLYWMGTAGVIADEPIFGTGPGNFRASYLSHKLAESSEEILDPHNIFLDAWCTAGLAGAVAVCLILITVLRPDHFAVNAVSSSNKQPTVADERRVRRTLLAGIGAGLVVHLGWRWLNGGDFIDTAEDAFGVANVVIAIPLAAFIFVRATVGKLTFSVVSVRAAFVCLFIHLLGAGGLHITAVGLLLLFLHSLSEETSSVSESALSSAVTWYRRKNWLVAAFLCLAAGITIWQGVVPVRAVESHSDMAAMLNSQGNHEGAIRAYDRAIAADPYDKKSRQRKMQVLSYVFMASSSQRARDEISGDGSDSDLVPLFDRAVASCDDVIESDVFSYLGYHFRSQLQATMHRSGDEVEACNAALSDMQHVIDCYPSNSLLWFEFAIQLDKCGQADQAREAAMKALEIERINQDWGHTDRYLSEPQLAELLQIKLAESL